MSTIPTLRTRAWATVVAFAVVLTSALGFVQPAWAADFSEVITGARLNLINIANTDGDAPIINIVDQDSGLQYAPATTLLRAPGSTYGGLPGHSGILGYVIDDGSDTEAFSTRAFAIAAPALAGDSYDQAILTLRTSGPADARVLVYTLDSDGVPHGITTSGNTELGAVSTIRLTNDAAISPYWAFVGSGTFVVHVTAELSNAATKAKASVEQTYTFHAGGGMPDTSAILPLAFADTVEPGTGGDSGSGADSGSGSDTGSDSGTETPAEPFGVVPSPTAPVEHQKDPVSGKDLLYRTHVDAAHIFWHRDQQTLAVGVIDGKSLRPAADVAVRLGPDANSEGQEVSRFVVPDGRKFAFLGAPGTVLWNAPRSYFEGWPPVWPGFGASAMPDSIDPASIKLHMVGVDGPGDLFVWLTYGSDPEQRFNSRDPKFSSVTLSPGAHGHFNWSFTKAGRYTTIWKATATTREGATISSDLYDVLWLVGRDSDVNLPAGTTSAATIVNSVAPFEPGPGQSPGSPHSSGGSENPGGDTPGGDSSNPSQPSTPAPNAEGPQPGTYVCAAPGHFDLQVTEGAAPGTLASTIKDDTVQPAAERTSGSLVIAVPDVARHQLDPIGNRAPLSILGQNGTRIWTLPESQDPRLAWLGINSESLSGAAVARGLKLALADVAGPGRMVHWGSGILSRARVLLDSGSAETILSIAEPSHRHWATSFTKPGLYQATYRYLMPGESVDYTVFYAVGNDTVNQLCGTYLKDHKLDEETVLPGDSSGQQGPDSGGSAGSSDNPGSGGNAPGGQDTPNNPGTPGAPTGQCLPSGVTTVLDNGHVDMFNLKAQDDGSVQLNLREDVTGQHVIHDPATVVLRVKDSARLTLDAGQVPDGVPTDLFVLPQTQDSANKLLWAGWDTMDARTAGYDAVEFDVSYTSAMDGRISLWLAGAFSGFESRLSGGGYVLSPQGSRITQDYPAHTHVNWGFDKPGRYTLTVTAHLRSADGSRQTTTNTATYTIDVGHVECPSLTLDSDTVAQGGTLTINAVHLTPDSTAVFEIHSDPIVLPAVTANERGQASAQWNVPADFPVGQHTVRLQGHPQLAASLTVTAAANTDAGSSTNTGSAAESGANGAAAAGSGEANRAGASSKKAEEICLPTTITREATEEEAAKLARLGGGSGAANTATTVLTFAVGQGGGNANDGHFDVGPGIENQTVVAKVKDDRTQPANWVDPQSLTFGLSDAAKLKAPDALSFVATPGKDVWMIPATQIAGVPWLGMNSQREEIVNGTNGGVTFTLDAVDGPGKVAVFASGAFGSGVGDMVFNGAGSSYVLPGNTHAHYNWVFTEPGTYQLTVSMKISPKDGDLQGSASSGSGLTLTGEKGPNGRPMVKETVGRTPSGEACSLATTGASVEMVVGIAATLVLLGAGLVLATKAGPLGVATPNAGSASRRGGGLRAHFGTRRPEA